MGGGSRKLVGLHVLDRFQRGFEGLAVGGSGAAPSDHAFKLIAPVSELVAKLAQVAIEQGVDRVLGVAMQVNEGERTEKGSATVFHTYAFSVCDPSARSLSS